MIGIIALIVSGVSLLLNIIGLAIPYWQKVDVNFGGLIGVVTSHNGLWKSCSGDNCADITNAPSSLEAVRAMELLGMILLIGAIVCAILKLTTMKDQARLTKVAGGLAIFAGVLMIIGCIIYAADVKADDNQVTIKITSDLHAGFALCIIAGVGSIVGGILFIVAKDN